jgi:hypothetical protein
MDLFAFASEIVVPTVKEALVDRSDRRRVYVASIVTYCLVDYVAVEMGMQKSEVCDRLREACKTAFEVVQGVCNGTKHAGKLERGFSFKPGDDREVPAFAFDVPGAGWDQGRWDVPGLSVRIDGAEVFLDTCLQVVLLTLCGMYAAQLGNIDISFLDKIVLDARPQSAA